MERRVIKTHITKLGKAIAKHATTPLSKNDMKLYMTRAQDIQAQLDSNFAAIGGLCADDTEIAPYEVTFVEESDKITGFMLQLNTLLNPNVPGTGNQQPQGQAAAAASGSVNQQHSLNGEIRLPKIDVPKFSGDIYDWPSFRDLFQSTVHNSSRSNSQKLTYLKSALEDHCPQILGSMAITDSNYDTAWKILEDRYNNKRELFFAIIQRLTGQPTVQADSASSLRGLIDTTNDCVRSLGNNGVNVTVWDGIIVFHMLQRLDAKTRESWELSLQDTELPVLDTFIKFLNQRARALAAGEVANSTPTFMYRGDKPVTRSNHRMVHSHYASSGSCKLCNRDHYLNTYFKFLNLTVQQRREAVGKLNVCYNCLREGHGVRNCGSNYSCQECKERHHTLVHDDGTQVAREETNKNSGPVFNHYGNDNVSSSLLATAMIGVVDVHGNPQLCRALLDCGSTVNFITESCCQRLGLQREYALAEVRGLAAKNVGMAKGKVRFKFRSRFATSHHESFSQSALVLPSITSKLPVNDINVSNWDHVTGLSLADPNFHQTGTIDVLLGAGVFDLLRAERRPGSKGSPSCVNSQLGWLVAGNYTSDFPSTITVHHVLADLTEVIQKFWGLESVPKKKPLSQEERSCEQHFPSTDQDPTSRFIVKLPFKFESKPLGSSRENALRCFLHNERKLTSRPQQQQQLQLMSSDQPEVRKWSSNSTSILAALPAEFRETQLPLPRDTTDSVKTSGLYSNPGSDRFGFRVQLPPLSCTIRSQLLLTVLQDKYWMLNTRNGVKFHLHKCVTCVHHNPPPTQQLMVDLSEATVKPACLFVKCGVYFAAPFMLFSLVQKSKVTIKGYLAICVCFVILAVHREVVSAMTTEAFSGAFQSYLPDNSIQWKFNPPRAPHMRGLLEAGVKSAKYHLHRVVGPHRLTFEESFTVAARTEAILKSRPLYSLMTDPADDEVLTPEHILIGRSLISVPEPDLTDVNDNRLRRWEHVKKMMQVVWRRWTREYFSRLQQRPKWLHDRSEFHVNDLVLIRDERQAPLTGPRGRIVKLHPGPDGKTRVVTIKTAINEIQLPIVKLCLLPVD